MFPRYEIHKVKEVPLYRLYELRSDGTYSRFSSRDMNDCHSVWSLSPIEIRKIDSCSLFIPYRLHLWLENHLFFPHAEKLEKKYGRKNVSQFLSFKFRDFLYGLVSGFPLCCSFFYSFKRENGQVGDGYVKCRRCMRNGSRRTNTNNS